MVNHETFAENLRRVPQPWSSRKNIHPVLALKASRVLRAITRKQPRLWHVPPASGNARTGPVRRVPGTARRSARTDPSMPAFRHSLPIVVAARTWPLRTSLELHAQPSAPRSARLHSRHVLQKWNLAHLGEPAELIISELVTNAIQASCAVRAGLVVQFAMFSNRQRLLIQVRDTSNQLPVAASSADTTETGRGLILVNSLSSAWGWNAQPDGKVVWALLNSRLSWP